MSDDRPTRRRDLMKPVQLLGLALIAALFAGIVTLVSMGFFQQRFASQPFHALMIALIVAGITFIVTVVVIALLLLAVDPAQITREVSTPVLLPPGAAAPVVPSAPAEAAPADAADAAPEPAEPSATDGDATAADVEDPEAPDQRGS